MSAVALAVSLLSYSNQKASGATSAPRAEPVAASAPGSVQPPDLSTMTPREAADRLYNRVMAASERGDTAEVTQFTPMALQAYANLGTLDNDARYHVAMIKLTAGDTDGAREQVDMLRKTTPKHLLSYLLEYEIAKRTGNKDAVNQVFRDFLSAYSSELATAKPEYQDHINSIESFQKTALAGLGRN